VFDVERLCRLKTAVLPKLVLLAACFVFAGVPQLFAQEAVSHEHATVAQIVALDECEPQSFNMEIKDGGLGPDFCKNVGLAALGFTTSLSELFNSVAQGHPDPGWDFEPDEVTVKQGTTVVVTDQGGEPHTFTEVKQFGGGFIPPLNGGQDTVPECSGGFKNVAVAKTRIIQGSTVNVTDLSKGEHLFQCCIHPWMRVKVEVK
jgi:plastocyanin